MLRISLVLLLALAVLAAAAPMKAQRKKAVGLCYKPATVPELNVTQYLGTWYQIAASPLVMDTMERNSCCVAAHYSLLPNKTIGVLNEARKGHPNGNYTTVDGWAYVPDPAYPGQLKVYLQQAYFPQIGAPYWVLQLGPALPSTGQYEWALVSDQFCASLFALARQPIPPTSVVQDMQAYAEKVGFTASDWIPTLQQGCVY